MPSRRVRLLALARAARVLLAIFLFRAALRLAPPGPRMALDAVEHLVVHGTKGPGPAHATLRLRLRWEWLGHHRATRHRAHCVLGGEPRVEAQVEVTDG